MNRDLVSVSEDVLWHVATYTIPAAMALLPGKMTSPEATAMLLAIGLQESGFIARQQGGTAQRQGTGPAKSWWQFERTGGCAELLEQHTPSRALLEPVCAVLGYAHPTPTMLHEAMEHNDVLACVMARLLLWKDPRRMPAVTNPSKGWAIYLARWRPGRPHPDTWARHFATAWRQVQA